VNGLQKRELRIGLALSGGTARAIVHVGVLKALDEGGIRVDLLAGTSGGALVGALYAAGLPLPRLEEVARHVRWRDLAGIRLQPLGFFSSDGISRFLIRQIGDLAFRDLRRPLGVVATDLISGDKVVLREGNVAEAVQASCSIPQVYTPVERDGRWLVDGALVECLPAQTVREMGADLVIGVNARCLACPPDRPRNMFQVAVLAVGVTASWNTRASEEVSDVVLHPDVSTVGPFSLEAAPELIQSGYACAHQMLPRVRDAIARRAAGT
jgi:NTE family protein